MFQIAATEAQRSMQNDIWATKTRQIGNEIGGQLDPQSVNTVY